MQQTTKTQATVRKLVIAGALLILIFGAAEIAILTLEFSSILNSILGYPHQSSVLPSGPYFIGPNIFDFNLDIIIFGVSLLLLSSALAISSYKTKQEDPSAGAMWAKLLLPLSILLIVVSVAGPHIMFDNDSFLYSLLPSATSLISMAPTLLGTTGTQSPLLGLLISLILPVIGLAGALFAICGSLLSTWSEHRKYAINVIAITIVIIALISVVSYIAVSSDNAAAIVRLNGEIAVYNTGYSYLLSNRSLYSSTIGRAVLPGISNGSFYDTLLSAERPHDNLSSFFTSYDNITPPENQGYIDFGSYNPIVRAVTIASIGFSGLPVDAYTLFPYGAPSNWLDNMTTSKGQLQLGPDGSIYLMPPFASTLKSIYELNSVGEGELLTSAALSNMFSCDIFRDGSAAPAYYGVSLPVQNQQFLGNLALTGESQVTKASALGSTGQLPLKWLAISMGLNGIKKGLTSGYFQCSAPNAPANPTTNTTRLPFMQLFYMLSLIQYNGYGTSQMLYNQSFGPSIEFIGYQGNYLIINLGNLNLTSNAPIKAYVDNKSIDYSRYFNYLLAQNMTLPPGFHNLEVTIGSNGTSETKLNAQFFVSPFLMLSSTMNESDIQISIANPSGNSIIIHNPELFANTTNPELNASFQNIGYTYAGIGNFSLAAAYNVTSITNSTGYSITANTNQVPASSLGNFTLGANKTIKLVYSTGQYCSIGQTYTYYLHINTSAGQYFQVILDSCT